MYVQDMCWVLFTVYRGCRYENNTFFEKCGAVTSAPSVRPQAVGLYQPADWLAVAERWPATMTLQACRNLICPCVFTNVGR